MNSWHQRKLATISALLTVALLAGCQDAPPQNPLGNAPPAVTVLPVTTKPYAASQQFVGKTITASRVDIRARVTGFLVEEPFVEGSDIEKDALLYKIDPVEFKAAEAAAKATVEKAEASLTEAQQTLSRRKELADRGTISQAELDEAVAAEAGAQADVLAAQADLDAAKINLDYTQIHSPIAGRIGSSNVDVGNLIGPDSGVLATVIALDPIRVSFSLAERTYLKLITELEEGEIPHVVPRIRLADGEMYDQEGKIAFAENQVDPNTGTVGVIVDFPNPKKFLLPGQFVNVILTSATSEEQILIPQAAVQLNQAGPFVLVVDGDNKVELRQITTGAIDGADIVVTDGLTVGEQIIIDGIQKVRPGGEVTVTAASAPADS